MYPAFIIGALERNSDSYNVLSQRFKGVVNCINIVRDIVCFDFGFIHVIIEIWCRNWISEWELIILTRRTYFLHKLNFIALHFHLFKKGCLTKRSHLKV